MIRLMALMLAASVVLATANPLAAQGKESENGPNGLHYQPWFLESFLELRDDIAEAGKAGKHFVLMWEQEGCPYCREMHVVNFADPKIVAYIKKNFVVVQLDLWGGREVTDFDGEVLSEKALARKHRVQFTPTISFYAPPGADEANKAIEEIGRLPGYVPPKQFLAVFTYIAERHYKTMTLRQYFEKHKDELS